jgi:hypothetical protein
VFYETPGKRESQKSKPAAQKDFLAPIVTEISPIGKILQGRGLPLNSTTSTAQKTGIAPW